MICRTIDNDYMYIFATHNMYTKFYLDKRIYRHYYISDACQAYIIITNVCDPAYMPYRHGLDSDAKIVWFTNGRLRGHNTASIYQTRDTMYMMNTHSKHNAVK